MTTSIDGNSIEYGLNGVKPVITNDRLSNLMAEYEKTGYMHPEIRESVTTIYPQNIDDKELEHLPPFAIDFQCRNIKGEIKIIPMLNRSGPDYMDDVPLKYRSYLMDVIRREGFSQPDEFVQKFYEVFKGELQKEPEKRSKLLKYEDPQRIVDDKDHMF